MKLVFLPTLTDIQGMLGENLYVDLIWMSRERDQSALSKERFATWASKISAWNAGATPNPDFARMDLRENAEDISAQFELPIIPMPQDSHDQSVHELTSLLEKVRPSESIEDYPLRASSGRR